MMGSSDIILTLSGKPVLSEPVHFLLVEQGLQLYLEMLAVCKHQHHHCIEALYQRQIPQVVLTAISILRKIKGEGTCLPRVTIQCCSLSFIAPLHIGFSGRFLPDHTLRGHRFDCTSVPSHRFMLLSNQIYFEQHFMSLHRPTWSIIVIVRD